MGKGKRAGIMRGYRKYDSGNRKYRLPNLSTPIIFSDFHKNSLYLDSYLLGCLLGDGGIKYSINFSSADKEIIDSFNNLLPKELVIKFSRNYDYRIVKKEKGIGKNNSLITYLKKLSLFGKGSKEKFIPKNYLLSSVESRIALLQGLLDTDGYIPQKGVHINYTTISNQLCKDVCFLVRSLGGNVKVKESPSKYKSSNGDIIHCNLSYRLLISFPK